MEKYYEEWDGKKYPVRLVPVDEVIVGYSPIAVADYELWAAIQHDCNNPTSRHKEANRIDDSIYYFCDSGFIDSDPTDKEIREYLRKIDVI